MRKHLISAIAALALLLTAMLPAAAVAPGMSNAALRQFRAGYIQDGKAYVYLQLEPNQLANIQLQLKVNETVIEQQSSGFIKEGDKPVHYLLLVDSSSTVRSYKEQLSLFACGVLEQTIAGGGAAEMTVAGLGDSFRILTENCTDPETLRTSLNELSYSDSNTDLYTGIQDALSYIQSKPHSSGELYQLILVTDGRQDKNGQLGLTQEQLEELEASFVKRQDIVFHTYGVSDEWDNQELRQAELGRGCHLSLAENLPDTAAQTIAGFTNELYQGVFKLEAEMVPALGESLKIQVLFADQPGGTSVVEIPSLDASADDTVTPEGETVTEGDDATNEGEEVIPENGQDAAETNPDDAVVDEAETSASAADNSKMGIGIWLLIPVAVIAALGGWLLRRQMESVKRSRENKVLPPPGAVCIRINVERGRCLTRERSLYLVHELIIGRSNECDLVFDEPELADRNSRILMRDNEIYLEDLGSSKGTSIGGMRIYAPNRLRSGDVISIGTAVQIRVEYDRN